MKYTITIDQKRAIEWGLNLSDASVFSLYTQAPTWATPEVINGEVYYFVSRNKVAEELPILAGKSKSARPASDTIYRINKKLAKIGVLVYKRIGRKDCIQLTEMGKKWNSEINPSFKSEINPTNKYTNIDVELDNSTGEFEDSILEIVEHLNQRAGKNFRHTTKATAAAIRARLREGFTVQDCKDVIDHRVAQWGMNPKMQQYLRPSTLFRPSKFEGYLDAARKSNTINQIDELVDRKLTEEQTHQYLDYHQHVKETYPRLFTSVKMLTASEFFGLESTYPKVIFNWSPYQIRKKREAAHQHIEEQLEYGRQFVDTWHEFLRELEITRVKEAVSC